MKRYFLEPVSRLGLIIDCVIGAIISLSVLALIGLHAIKKEKPEKEKNVEKKSFRKYILIRRHGE